MTTLILQLSPKEAAKLELAGQCIGRSREQAAKDAIRLFLRSMPAPAHRRRMRKAVVRTRV